MNKPQSRLILVVSSIFFIVLLLLGFYSHYHSNNNYLQIIFLNICQGDATLITTTEGQHILIDCGPPDQAILNALDQQLAWWDRNIDIIIITHDHADHWGGLRAILTKYKVNQIILAQPPQMSTDLTSILDSFSSKGTKITNLYAPAIINLTDGSRLAILWPTQEDIVEQKNINNQSLVIKWQYGQKSFLWTGDLETDAEDKLMARYINQEPINVLKVAHHGSWTATSPQWLNYWQPDLAVISVGINNNLGLPNEITLDRLKRQGISIWRTDIDNRLVIYTDGQALWR